MGMLKGNAVNEVESNRPKMGMVDLGKEHGAEATAVPCSHEMCMGGACKMSDGGMVANDGVDELSAPDSLHPEPESAELSGSESAELHPAPKGEIENEDEENNQSSFMGLMKKVKK